MPRRRRGQPVHGWVVLDKPSGLTSTQAVGRVRRLFDAEKAGHAGTLDPLATGVLPIALGEATKTVPYAMDAVKRYRFRVRWGEARDTDDAEGKVTETNAGRPDQAAILAALPRFIGAISQVPPAYSAIKVDGERAYDLAREDVQVSLAPRLVQIEEFVLVGQPSGDAADFEVRSGKGTYMRALARDLARALGTVGHVTALRRLAVGAFDESRAISLERLEELGHSPALLEHLLPVETALDDIPALALAEDEASRLRHGQPVSLLRRADRPRLDALLAAGDGPEVIACALAEGRPVAIVRLVEGALHPVRVLNL